NGRQCHWRPWWRGLCARFGGLGRALGRCVVVMAALAVVLGAAVTAMPALAMVLATFAMVLLHRLQRAELGRCQHALDLLLLLLVQGFQILFVGIALGDLVLVGQCFALFLALLQDRLDLLALLVVELQ